jgi:hypothetical protein
MDRLRRISDPSEEWIVINELVHHSQSES